MSPSLLDQYRRLFNELLFRREAEGGELPVDVESSYVGRLDDLWCQLSVDDQNAFESELASAEPPGGPEVLNLVDCAVIKGSHDAPRKAA